MASSSTATSSSTHSVDQRAGQRARALDGDAVGERHDRPGRRRSTGVRRAHRRLHADDPDVRPQRLDGDRQSRRPARRRRPGRSRSDRSAHVVDELEPERALAGDRRPGRRTGGRTPCPSPRRRGRGRRRSPRRARRRPRRPSAPYARHASILVIGAPAGTKMSHGTPKWLGGERQRLGVVAGAAGGDAVGAPPRRATASLFIAPRILNAPVRCRLSALSTTSPPRRCDRVTDETIGVCLATAGRRRREPPGCRRASPRGHADRTLLQPHPRVSCTGCRRVALRCHEPLGWGTTRTCGEGACSIGNADGLDAGFVGNRLREQRLHGSPKASASTPRTGRRSTALDLVLTLGSEWNVYRPETAALVAAEAAYVRDAVEPRRSRCSGSASAPRCCRTPSAARSAVRRHPRSAGHELAVGPGPADRRRVRGWSGTTTCSRCPRASTSWPRTPIGPQLVAGRRAVGTQFHPEATETMVRDWIEHGGAESVPAATAVIPTGCWPRPRANAATQPSRSRGPRGLVPGAPGADVGLTDPAAIPHEAPTQEGLGGDSRTLVASRPRCRPSCGITSPSSGSASPRSCSAGCSSASPRPSGRTSRTRRS